MHIFRCYGRVQYQKGNWTTYLLSRQRGEMMEEKNRCDQEVAKNSKRIRSMGRQKSRARLLKFNGIWILIKIIKMLSTFNQND